MMTTVELLIAKGADTEEISSAQVSQVKGEALAAC